MPAAPLVAVAMWVAPHALASSIPMDPVPPEPAVMTTVRLVLFHGDPAPGSGPCPGRTAVRLREKSEVSPTSGMVAASCAEMDMGRSPVSCSSARTYLGGANHSKCA
jgi:hypothetical protein